MGLRQGHLKTQPKKIQKIQKGSLSQGNNSYENQEIFTQKKLYELEMNVKFNALITNNKK